jgi:hypothetical protein
VSIGREEAAQALKDAEAAAGRSAAATRYQQTSGYLILWGLVWGFGNLAAWLHAPDQNLVWFGLTLAGVVGSFILGVRRPKSGPGGGLKALLIAFSIAGFGFGVSAINAFHSFEQYEGIMCLAVGAAYVVLGTQTGLRMSAVGAAIMLVTVLSWTYARDQFFLWMAIAGGGGLILGGVWMRKV